MLGDRIKEMRSKMGITQIQLSEQLHVSQGTIGNWEAGNREPDYSTLQKIADYFDVTTDYLLGRADDPNIILESSTFTESVDAKMQVHKTKKDPADESARLEELLRDPVKRAAYEKLIRLSPEALAIANAQLDLLLKSQGNKETK